jgi:hypothetical protein
VGAGGRAYDAGDLDAALRDPMQLSAVALLLLSGIVLQNAGVAAAGAFLIRVPLVCLLIQLLADASGAEPRGIPPAPPTTKVHSPGATFVHPWGTSERFPPGALPTRMKERRTRI